MNQCFLCHKRVFKGRFSMRTLKIFIFSILLALASGEVSRAQETILTLGTLNWEPYVGEKLENDGFISEIVRESFRRAGIQIKIRYMPWARVIKELEKGSIDAAYPAYFSKERSKKFGVSKPFASSRLGFYKKKNIEVPYKKLEDLKSYRIGVVRGYLNSKEFDDAKYLKKDAVNSDLANLRKLLKGRLDLVVIDESTSKFLIKTNFPAKLNELEFLEPPLEEKPLYLLFSKKHSNFQKLLAGFNHGLNIIVKDGTRNKIIKYHKLD